MVKTTIMIKTKQVSHSKQETISIILTHPSPNPSATQNIAWQYNVTNLTQPKFQKLLSF